MQMSGISTLSGMGISSSRDRYQKVPYPTWSSVIAADPVIGKIFPDPTKGVISLPDPPREALIGLPDPPRDIQLNPYASKSSTGAGGYQAPSLPPPPYSPGGGYRGPSYSNPTWSSVIAADPVIGSLFPGPNASKPSTGAGGMGVSKPPSKAEMVRRLTAREWTRLFNPEALQQWLRNQLYGAGAGGM